LHKSVFVSYSDEEDDDDDEPDVVELEPLAPAFVLDMSTDIFLPVFVLYVYYLFLILFNVYIKRERKKEVNLNLEIIHRHEM
jgi:hypothetical protein